MSNTLLVLPGLHAHTSGALWLPDSKTVIIADVHLGYSWAQRRRGELGPLADFQAREKLFQVCAELKPMEIVFLGDLVHAPRPCLPEREWIEETLNQLSACARIIAVRGNHDRAFAREFGHLNCVTVESWSGDSLTAVHGDRLAHAAIPEKGTLIVGHLHPCLGVRDAAGAGQKLPVFLANSHCIVLPAFSPFARGYNVACGLTADLQSCFRGAQIHAYAVTKKRVVGLGPLRRAVESLSERDANAAARFRRRMPAQ